MSLPIRPLASDQVVAAAELWRAAGLTRPWNDPEADARLALSTPTSTILAARDGDEVIGTVMVGFDGHRAWVYYLAVAEARRGVGLGRALMAAAEAWVADLGAPKIELMVRETNAAASGFYVSLGYTVEPVKVFSRWLVERPG